MRRYFFLMGLLFICQNLFSFEINDLQLHLKVSSITHAAAPEIWHDYLILTYESKGATRTVGAAFSNDDYKSIESYMINEHGIFFLVKDLPENSELSYRLIIDGIWTPDPSNSNFTRDHNGLQLSSLGFTKDEQRQKLSPYISDDTVEFIIKSTPGKRIFLSGDFNRWDPYMTRLKEIETGVYSVTLRIKPGRYGYYFLIDGEPVVDPLNFQITQTNQGEQVSLLYIPN